MLFDGLKHVNLKVKDIERSTKFYTEGFGMQVTGTKYDGKVVALTTPGVGDALVLTEGVPEGMDVDFSGDARAGDSGGIDHIGFALRDAAQLDTAIERLVSLGAKLQCTLRPEKDTAFLRDPDGYVVQIDPTLVARPRSADD